MSMLKKYCKTLNNNKTIKIIATTIKIIPDVLSGPEDSAIGV